MTVTASFATEYDEQADDESEAMDIVIWSPMQVSFALSVPKHFHRRGTWLDIRNPYM